MAVSGDVTGKMNRFYDVQGDKLPCKGIYHGNFRAGSNAGSCACNDSTGLLNNLIA